MLGFLPLPLLTGFVLLGGTISFALDYLNRGRLPGVPETTGVQEPEVGGFTGGQCQDVAYRVNIRFELTNDGGATWIPFDDNTNYSVNGKVDGIEGYEVGDGRTGFRIFRKNSAGVRSIAVQSFPAATQNWRNFSIRAITRADSAPDTCGNRPNPNPQTNPSTDGIADSTAPSADAIDDTPIYEGAPLVAIPSFAAAITAAIAAIRAATNALAAVQAIADAIEAISKLLDRLKEFLDGVENPENRSIFRYDFGSIEFDGFLRLYPFVNTAKFKAELLDLQFLSIPTYYGKYFGVKSPNFYRFKELGYIAFVSPTFGVLSQVPLEFGRCSIPVPEDSIGFFFHLGLEGGIIANISCFYSVPPERE